MSKELEIQTLTMDSSIPVVTAYKAMYKVIETYWENTGRPGDVGDLLSGMSLTQTQAGTTVSADPAFTDELLTHMREIVRSEAHGEYFSGADLTLTRTVIKD